MTRTLRAVAVVLVALAAAAPVLTAVPAGAALVSFPDPTGDAGAQTDVTVASLSFGDGEIGVYVEIPGGPDPTTDPVWLDNNRTTSHFFFDIDGDGTADYTANYWWANTQTQQGLWSITSHYSDSDTAINCNATAGTWLSNGGAWRAYGIRFPKSCIDNPTSVSFRAMTDYGEVQNDMVPDTGFSPAVGECVGGCAPVWPSPTSSTTTTSTTSTTTTTLPPAGSTPPPATGAPTATVTDPMGDSPTYKSDATTMTLTYGSDGNLSITASMAASEAPWSTNWVTGRQTWIHWDLDTNGDNTTDYTVWYRWSKTSNKLVASVFRGDIGPDEIWYATAYYTGPPTGPEPGVHHVEFPASVIGDPASLRMRAVVSYSTSNDGPWQDSAPDTGWSSWASRYAPPISTPPPPAPPPAAPPVGNPPPADPGLQPAGTSSGYSMISADGQVYPFGSAPFCGHVSVSRPDRATDIEITPNGKGYWVLLAHGYVDFKWCANGIDDDWRTYEHNNSFADRLNPGENAVSLSVLRDGSGYWVFTDRGRALALGKAQWFGDMNGIALNGPVLGSVAMPDGRGYYMVASDGGIFAFGNARFAGSMGGRRLNAPVMSMAPDPDGSGYWLVASDGGIFAFDAGFYGSMGGTKLNKPISGMVPGRAGYLMVAEDGGIFAFGNVKFHGSLGANPPSSPVVAVALLS